MKNFANIETVNTIIIPTTEAMNAFIANLEVNGMTSTGINTVGMFTFYTDDGEYWAIPEEGDLIW